jgi:hypothetical protein
MWRTDYVVGLAVSVEVAGGLHGAAESQAVGRRRPDWLAVVHGSLEVLQRRGVQGGTEGSRHIEDGGATAGRGPRSVLTGHELGLAVAVVVGAGPGERK